MGLHLGSKGTGKRWPLPPLRMWRQMFQRSTAKGMWHHVHWALGMLCLLLNVKAFQGLRRKKTSLSSSSTMNVLGDYLSNICCVFYKPIPPTHNISQNVIILVHKYPSNRLLLHNYICLHVNAIHFTLSGGTVEKSQEAPLGSGSAVSDSGCAHVVSNIIAFWICLCLLLPFHLLAVYKNK